MKKLKVGFKSAYGRSHGRISSFHREAGHKKVYCLIDFSRNFINIIGKIKFIKKDGYRTGYVAGILYTNGYFSYMLALEGMQVGNFIFNKVHNFEHTNQDKIGLSCPLRYVKIGEKISNIEYFPGTGGKLARSAGLFAIIVKKYTNNVLIKLSSGEFRLFFLNCMCTIGQISNSKHHEKVKKKAGVNRILGWRPVVRGRAMNPVDHPHGGRTNGGIAPRTPWGFLTRGVKTVKNKKACIVKKK